MATFHILTQYIWPDAAPTGLYAEHLAARLHQNGCDVRLVGGKGNYQNIRARETAGADSPPRSLPRPPRKSAQISGNSFGQARVRKLHRQIRRQGDVVVATSAPPNTVQLAKLSSVAARARFIGCRIITRNLSAGCTNIRRLRAVFQPLLGSTTRAMGPRREDRQQPWRASENSVVIRNWPTFTFDEDPSPRLGQRCIPAISVTVTMSIF